MSPKNSDACRGGNPNQLDDLKSKHSNFGHRNQVGGRNQVNCPNLINGVGLGSEPLALNILNVQELFLMNQVGWWLNLRYCLATGRIGFGSRA